MGDKGGGSGSKVYDYYGTIAAAVCWGPVQHLLAVIIDSKEVWPKAKGWKPGDAIALNELRSSGGRTFFAKIAHVAAEANKPPNPTYWDNFSLSAGSSDYADLTIEGYGILRIYWGTETQTTDPKLAAAGNDRAEEHPPYRGLCYIVLKNFLFGRERTSAPNVEVVVYRDPAQTVVSGTPATLVDFNASLMAVAPELLTSDNGLGLPNAVLLGSSFQNAANTLQTHEHLAGCSPLFDTQGTVREFFNNLALLADSYLRFNPATKLIEAGVFTHGTPPASYTTLTIDDFTERPKFKAQGWNAAKTRAIVQFTDRARAYKQSSDKRDDLRAYRVLGEHRSITLQRPFITRRGQALKHALESLRTLARPQLNGTVYVRREKGRNIRPGDWVLVDIDLEPGGATLNQFFRVLERILPRRGPVQLTLDADELINATAGGDDEVLESEETVPVPAVANQRIIEVPVSLADYQTDRIIVLAERPSDLVTGFQLWFDTAANGTFQVLGESRGWATRCTLRTNLTDSAATVQVTLPAQVDDERLTNPASDLRAADDTLLAFLVEKDGTAVKSEGDEYQWVEVVSISAVTLVGSNDYDLTVLRGRQQTRKRAFTAANCEVWIIPRILIDVFHHGKFAELRENRIEGLSPDTGYFRLAPHTFEDSRDLADCANIVFQFTKSSPAGPSLTLTAPATLPVVYPLDWAVGQVLTAGSNPENRRWHNGAGYRCILGHTAAASNEPGVGAQWATYWVAEAPAYPYEFDVEGTWTDPNGDMTAFQLIVKKDGVATEFIDEDDSFAPVGVYTFNETVHIAENGTWRIKLCGFDVTGLVTKRIITVEARGATLKVARPKFKWTGKKVKGTEWNKYGKFKLTCATPSATIEFRYKIVDDRDWASGVNYVTGDKRWHNDVAYHCISDHTSGANNEPGVGANWALRWTVGDAVLSTGPWHTYDESNEGYDTQPYGWQPQDSIREIIEARATKGGYTTSEINTLTIRFKRVGNSDPAP